MSVSVARAPSPRAKDVKLTDRLKPTENQAELQNDMWGSHPLSIIGYRSPGFGTQVYAYKCIDTFDFCGYSVSVATLLCGLNGTRTRTGKTFASMMFALKPLFSFSTIRTLLRDVITPLTMRNAG